MNKIIKALTITAIIATTAIAQTISVSDYAWANTKMVCDGNNPFNLENETICQLAFCIIFTDLDYDIKQEVSVINTLTGEYKKNETQKLFNKISAWKDDSRISSAIRAKVRQELENYRECISYCSEAEKRRIEQKKQEAEQKKQEAEQKRLDSIRIEQQRIQDSIKIIQWQQKINSGNWKKIIIKKNGISFTIGDVIQSRIYMYSIGLRQVYGNNEHYVFYDDYSEKQLFEILGKYKIMTEKFTIEKIKPFATKENYGLFDVE